MKTEIISSVPLSVDAEFFELVEDEFENRKNEKIQKTGLCVTR